MDLVDGKSKNTNDILGLEKEGIVLAAKAQLKSKYCAKWIQKRTKKLERGAFRLRRIIQVWF